MSSTRFQDVFQDVFKMCLQDVFFKMSSKRLQEDVLQLCLEDVLEDKKCYTEDVFTRRMFAGNWRHSDVLILKFKHIRCV